MFKLRKGQITIEFVLSTLFFIIMLATLVYLSVDYVPEVEELNERARVNMEARRATSMILTNPGMNISNDTSWQSSPNAVKSFGLASSYHVVQRSKIQAIETRSGSKFNYSQFKQITGFENEYRFEFTVFPVIDAPRSFQRSEPPEDPNITEPVNADYVSSGNKVNYGRVLMGGDIYNVLVTSHDGSYDTVYRIQDSVDRWNFSGAPRFQEGDSMSLGARDFRVESFQNRGEGGTKVILSRSLKSFGPPLAVDSTIITIERYAAFSQPGANLQPLRMEVLAWRPS